MIDWTPLTRDILDALATGPIDPNTRVLLARAEVDRAGDIDQRAFAFSILKEEPTWKDRCRARRARLALREPRLQDRMMIVVSLKILELVDEIGAMTGHERIAMRRRIPMAFAQAAAEFFTPGNIASLNRWSKHHGGPQVAWWSQQSTPMIWIALADGHTSRHRVPPLAGLPNEEEFLRGLRLT